MNRAGAAVLLCGALLFGRGHAAPPPEPLQGGERILWVGNSYSDWFGPTHQAISLLLAETSPPITGVYFRFIVKGMGIVKEYATWSSLGVIAAIRQGNWDYVIIQTWEDAVIRNDCEELEDGSPNPAYVGNGWPSCQDTLLKYLGALRTEINAVGARTIVYQPHVATWSYLRDFPRSIETHNLIASTYPDVYVAPTIHAWDSMRVLYPTTQYTCPGGGATAGSFIYIFYHDCGHQNGVGMALDAYTLFTIFTGRSGIGLNPTWLESMTGGTRWDPSYLPVCARVGTNAGMNARAAATAINRSAFGCAPRSTRLAATPPGFGAQDVPQFAIDGRRLTGTDPALGTGSCILRLTGSGVSISPARTVY